MDSATREEREKIDLWSEQASFSSRRPCRRAPGRGRGGARSRRRPQAAGGGVEGRLQVDLRVPCDSTGHRRRRPRHGSGAGRRRRCCGRREEGLSWRRPCWPRARAQPRLGCTRRRPPGPRAAQPPPELGFVVGRRFWRLDAVEPGQGEYVVSWRWSAARGVAGVAGDEAAEKGDLEVASRDGRRTDCGSGGWPNKERKNERIFSRNFKFVSRLWPKILVPKSNTRGGVFIWRGGLPKFPFGAAYSMCVIA